MSEILGYSKWANEQPKLSEKDTSAKRMVDHLAASQVPLAHEVVSVSLVSQAVGQGGVGGVQASGVAGDEGQG